jgi:hypothetical protein
MRVWTCRDHDGHWPVGTASVIVAESEEQAQDLLKAELRAQELNPEEPFTLQELNTATPCVRVLRDGEY